MKTLAVGVSSYDYTQLQIIAGAADHIVEVSSYMQLPMEAPTLLSRACSE